MATPSDPSDLRTRHRGRTVLVAAAIVLGGGGLVACAGSDDPAARTTTTRPAGDALTQEDGARLAQALFRNHTDGGATVAVAFDYSPDLSVRIEGDVDWKGHAGRFDVTSTFADGRPQEQQEVVFQEDAVYESPTPDEAAAFEAAGRPEVEWVKRAPDTDGRPLDRVIGLVVALAATRPDNPQLLAQGDTTFERREDVDGRAADVFTSGSGATYWIAARDDRLVRFRGTLSGFGGPVLVDISDPGPRTTEIPSGDAVAEATGTTVGG